MFAESRRVNSITNTDAQVYWHLTSLCWLINTVYQYLCTIMQYDCYLLPRLNINYYVYVWIATTSAENCSLCFWSIGPDGRSLTEECNSKSICQLIFYIKKVPCYYYILYIFILSYSHIAASQVFRLEAISWVYLLLIENLHSIVVAWFFMFD